MKKLPQLARFAEPMIWLRGCKPRRAGDFAVHMEMSVFHVGTTNVNYYIYCTSSHCNVVYNLFVNDGFWDVDFVDEKVLGGWFGIPFCQPDGMGPNLERLGGSPYPYIPTNLIYSFPNPGY